MPIQESAASVGILVGVKDEKGRQAVLLHLRPPQDSFPGGAQVTAAGKLTPNELKLDEPQAMQTALGRELREEIGKVAAEMIKAAFINAKGQLVVTKGVDLGVSSEEFKKLIVPGSDTGRFITCHDPGVILALEGRHKTEGVPAGEIRMFPDEAEAVRKFFQKFYGVSTPTGEPKAVMERERGMIASITELCREGGSKEATRVTVV